jgi:uncharacterized SAM-binding protein YcdF (DUF218 family)
VLSGKSGHWTRHLWSVPEASVFRDRAIKQGIAAERILLEPLATNFGENVAFVRHLLPEAKAITFVTKPNSVLRAALTAAIQWPAIQRYVDAPPLQFPAEVSQIIGVLGAIHEMVGDIHRILEYPACGFQQSYPLPAWLLDDWRQLIADGFDIHLLADRPLG